MVFNVLVVDDERSLTEMYAEILEMEFGIQAVVIHNLADALDQDPNSFDLALVDGNFTKGIVTGDDGRAVTNHLVEKNPGIQILGISGADYQTDDFWAMHGAFLQKPVGFEELTEAVTRLFALA